ncbi:MAG: putative CRISPR-associated protein [Desulfomicrobiaceae bacterium]
MPTLMVSTCGTSLLMNTNPEARQCIHAHANVPRADALDAATRTALRACITTAQKRLEEASVTEMCRLSAELNAIVRFFHGDLKAPRDTHHLLLATDTFLGEAAATAIAATLQRHGHSACVQRITDLRTSDLEAFRLAMSEIVRLCAHEIQSYRQRGYRVVFNLTGGFKSVQGFMQALGMIYADESISIFENTSELLRLPKLPLAEPDALTIVREHHRIFRRLAAGLPVRSQDARQVPETLLMELDGMVTFSIWGELIWNEGRKRLFQERIWESVDPKIQFGPDFLSSTEKCSAAEKAHINERILDLTRFHCGPRGGNINRLDLKKLRQEHNGSTHECDAWASGEAKRIFLHYEGDSLVLDLLDSGLH